MANNVKIKSSGSVFSKMKNIRPVVINDEEEMDVIDVTPVETESVRTEIVRASGLMVPVVESLGDMISVPDSTRAVLNVDELEIYRKETQEWFTAHPDWNAKEDLDDIYGIAMEKVMQYRLLAKQKKKPYLDIEKNYNSSVERVHKFRTNLCARRSDRISDKKKSTVHQTNIAIIAGQMDDRRMNSLKELNNRDEDEELKMFPEG
jgi:hypothetical protein